MFETICLPDKNQDSKQRNECHRMIIYSFKYM